MRGVSHPACAGIPGSMIILGIILTLIGWLIGPPALTTIGLILLVIGIVLNVVPMGGERRRVW